VGVKPINTAVLVIGLALLGAGLVTWGNVVAYCVVGFVLAIVAMGGDMGDKR
jgi:hypothetical protein